MIENVKIKAELLLLLVAISWGLGFPVMKMAISLHGVFTVLWLRFLLAFIVMSPLFFHKKNYINHKTILHGIFLGTLLFLTFAFFISGLNYTTSSNTGFLAALSIMWVPIFNKLFFKKPIEPTTTLAIIVAFIGIFFLSSPQRLDINSGDILVIIGAIFSAAHILSIDKIGQKSDPLVLTTIQIITMTAFSFLMCLLLGKRIFPEQWDANLITAIFITAILATAVAFWIQTKYQADTKPETATIIYNLEPVFSAFFSIWLLKEKLSSELIIGGGIILVSVFIASFPDYISLNYLSKKNFYKNKKI